MLKQASLGNWMCLLVITGFSSTAIADHAWNNYHWARAANPLQLKVIDSVTSNWQNEFETALDGWNASSEIDMYVAGVDENSTVRKRCNAKEGHMRICNASYGKNGWLGLASVYLDSNAHITKGIAKMNDFYQSYWAIPGEKNHVICQEIGHVLGLGHTSEDGTSQGTCMDYSTDINSQWPNAHDLEQLALIYSHLDSYNANGATGSTTNTNCTEPGNCSKNNAADPAPVPMGVLVHRGHHHEIRVAPGENGGLWVHHIRLVPEEYLNQ